MSPTARHCVFLGLMIHLLSGCVSGANISELDARGIALKIASNGQLHLSGALEGPSNIRAEMITLSTAKQRGAGDVGGDDTYPSDMMVWLVTMDGKWTIAGGPPTPEGMVVATPQPFHHLSMILDAVSGKQISISAHP
jgi:hypothetical protein